MKILIHILFMLFIVIFVLNDINIIYTNSVLLPDYIFISAGLYFIPNGQWNQAYVPFPALFIFVMNLITNTSPLTLLSIFYIIYKYIYVFFILVNCKANHRSKTDGIIYILVSIMHLITFTR